MTLTLAAASVLIAISILVYRQVVILRRRAALSPEWMPDLTVDRYRPMFRLLAEDDIRFLRSQPGAAPALVRRLRRQRCRIFRSYLRCLARDFQMTSNALMVVMLNSQSDRHDMVRALLGSRLKFAIAILRVRCRLILYRWNVGHEPVAHLVSLFEGLQLELLAFMPAPESAAS